MNLSDFNSSNVPSENSYEMLPAGTYKAAIIRSESKLTKKANETGNPSDGTMLVLCFQVLEGPYAGRTVFSNINYMNHSEVAEKIGRQQLASIYRAFDVTSVSDSSELHDKPIQIIVKIKEGTNGYGPRAEVVKYSKWVKPQSAPVFAQPSQAPVQAVANDEVPF